MSLKIFELDPTLKGCEGQIWDRVNGYKWWKDELEKSEGGIAKFAEGYRTFGFNRTDGGFVFREWLPNARQVFLIGEFNDWQNTMPLHNEGFGKWSVKLPDGPGGRPVIKHPSQLKVRMETHSGQWCDRVPAWTKLAWQDHTTNAFNGVYWEPEERYTFKHPRPAKPERVKIYEAHVGMASFEPKVATYLEFARDVLPRIKSLGYNTVQLMAVSEHAHYGCFGYHVTSFFAPASRSGTPEELKEMIDTAHGLGIQVLMDLVHAHCSSNTMDGIAEMDGTDHCYTHGGPKGHHSEWDSKIFHYTKHEVLRFLLSNVRWWLEEYGFDGFRFDGITSMLYHSHGIGKGYTGGYHEYFGPDADIESHIYLMLANDLIHTLVPSAITIAEDVSGMPTIGRPVEEGGFGFDYRLAMAIPDMFIKLLKECSDDGWDMGHITHTLTNRRWKEKVVAYVESHDQAIVGDKTIAFWLMDAEMYTGMSLVQTPQPSMIVDRGLSLHKMIRLLVLGLGGEGYLNFMGNEFGHPEWIDFPRPENGGSYQHCRRRWDLADADHLRYKFFQAFDVLMQAAENRYEWMGSEHQYVTLKNEGDKVIAFERGDCLFVFNLHPCNSYTDYQIGVGFDEPLRTVLDTDEGRFGGHMRLEHGHANSFPLLEAAQNRSHSIKMYLPSRTAQVLVKESLVLGGVRIFLEDAYMKNMGLAGPEAIAFAYKTEPEDTSASTGKLKFNEDGILKLDAASATFELHGPDGKAMPCRGSFDGVYRIYFPGDYTISGSGYIGFGAPSGAPPPDPLPTRVAKAAEEPAAPAPALPATAAAAAPSAKECAAGEGVDSPLRAPEGDGDDASEASFHNLPDLLSDAGGLGNMGRVASLSAFEQLIGPEEAVQLRAQMEAAAEVEDRPVRYGAKHLSTPVVVVSSEVNPWSKTGGLGMVASSYAQEFAMRGHRTMAISPRYDDFKNAEYCGYAKIWLNGQEHEVKYFHLRQEYGGGRGCDFIFVEHDCYKRPAGLYCDTSSGKEYEDNLFRFALLSLAATEAPLILSLGGSIYGQECLFIANDWQTSLVPVYLLYKYRRNSTYLGARTLLVIHNLGYQGKYRKLRFPVDSHLGLPHEAIDDLQGEDLNMGVDCLNLLQAGIKTCDRVLTVSPNYCTEIQSPEGGFGMHEVLKQKGAMLRMGGILNGISDEWNPLTDPSIPRNYGPKDFLEIKPICKQKLQEELGLHQDPNLCLLGFCGRLCYQKGIHLITAMIGWLMQDQGNGVNGRVQVILMGKGDQDYAQQIQEAEATNKGRVCGYVGFDPNVEHRMMAGCDMILMPSQYEPCGLPQMYAQQYGTLPVVHETGGLKDSVQGLWDINRDRTNATGFLFSPFEPNPLRERLYQAMHIFHHDKELFQQMQTNAIKSDFYWPRALDEYEKHIDWTFEANPCR